MTNKETKEIADAELGSASGGMASDAVIFYTAKQGDTIESIAKRFHTTPQRILELNNGIDPDLLDGLLVILPAIS